MKSPLPIGVVSSRSSVPGRALAQGGDAGHDEHHDEREDPEQRGAESVEDGGAVEDPRQQADQHAGDDEHQPDGAVVGAQLGQDAAGGDEGAVGVHRRLLGGAVDQGEEGLLGIVGAGAREQGGQGVVGEEPPSRSSSSRSQRLASSMTWLDTSSERPCAARRLKSSHRSRRSTGSSPTVGSSRTSSSGSPTRAAASEARER